MAKKSRHARSNRPNRHLFILDWYVHQGHQYEFFKVGHKFHLVGLNGGTALWNSNHRPLGRNVILTPELNARQHKYDVVMVRSSLNPKRYKPFMKKNTKCVAVVQTTTPFPIPSWVRHVVWNSYVSMKKYKGSFPGKNHYYIPHGYNSNEFVDLKLQRNNRILTVANVFKGRRKIMGYDLWKYISRDIGVCDVFGHGNEDMDGKVRRAGSLENLINIYNTYGIFLNTTIESAMPRSRAEAAMCGCPIISTDNYDVGMYFKHKKNAILTNNKDEMLMYIKQMLQSKQMASDYGGAAREVAIKHFNLKDYIQRWHKVFGDL